MRMLATYLQGKAYSTLCEWVEISQGTLIKVPRSAKPAASAAKVAELIIELDSGPERKWLSTLEE